MTRPPCKWLRKTNLGCFCVCQVFFTRKSFVDESHCLGCTVYEPSTSVCPTCKHYDNATDNEEEFCHALGEVIGDTAMGNSKITSCEYWCEDNLKDDTVVKVKSSCKYLDIDNDTQKFICHYTSLNGGASMILSGDTCLKCNYHEAKEPSPMIICKYQNENNDCVKSSQRTFACVFARCNAWDAAELRCKYFEHTHESKLCDILCKIPESDLKFIEQMFKTDANWTIEQISLSLSSRYDP